ncbi:hypothetical protein EZS27_038802, partial [termite gut metagenome]
MQHFIKSIFLFVLYFLGMFCLLIFIHGTFAPDQVNPFKSSYGHLHSRLKEVKKIENVDILFLGSSHTYRAFDTRIFQKQGYFTFNLGSSAQTALQTKLLLKKYITKLNPKLVVFEVNPNTFSNEGIESALDVINNEQLDSALVKMVFTINHYKTYRNLIYAFAKDLFKLNVNYHQPVKIAENTYITGGYVERDLDFFKEPQNIQKITWKPNKKQLEAFNEIISFFKEQNIYYMLVSTPITQQYYNSLTNRSEFNDLMKNHGIYYDFNETLQLNDSLCFYDM